MPITEPSLAHRLAELPRLDTRNLVASSKPCKLCGERSTFFDVVDLNKHCSHENPYAFGPAGISVSYHRCEACGFLFTTFFDEWSREDFTRYIYNDDYIKVDGDYEEVRPNAVADTMAERLAACEELSILDYGSGTGRFAERMRACGFTRIDSYDPFSSPERPTGRYDIVTCFEVIEHTVSPVAAVLDMKSFLTAGGCIIFSQTLQPADIAQVRGSWWYLAPRNGHVSTFTADALGIIADRAGLIFRGTLGPYAFGQPEESAKVAPILSGIGLPVFAFELTAPDPRNLCGGAALFDAAVWHEAEPHGQEAMRWTKTTPVAWPPLALPRRPCRLKLRIPVLEEVEAGFARRCRIEVDGSSGDVTRGPKGLDCEVTLGEGGAAVVTLITPAPVTPRQARGVPDDRALGVAIRAK